MFTAQMNFQQIWEWFKDSKFQNLIMFLPSLNLNDSVLDEHIIKNQNVIDCLTGDHTAFIYINDMVCKKNTIGSIRNNNIPRGIIRCGYDVTSEMTTYFHIPSYKLPAIIVIDKHNNHKLYPIKTKQQLDLLFTPIGIITSYRRDKHDIENRLLFFYSIDTSISHAIEQQKIIFKEIVGVQSAINASKENKEIGIKIDTVYRSILNDLRIKGVKNNVVNSIFETLNCSDDITIIDKLKCLGMSDSLEACSKDLLSNMRKIHMLHGFRSHIGKVPKQVKKHLHNLPSLLEHYMSQNHYYEERLNELYYKKQNVCEEVESLNHELKEMFNAYGVQLSQIGFAPNQARDLLHKVDNNKECLTELLDIVYSNRSNEDPQVNHITSVKVFIAGSTRLVAERDALRSVIGQIYNKYKEDNLLIEAYSFDDFPREFTEGGHQKLYDEFIRKEANWVVFITDGEIGEKTIWELENAINAYKSDKRPKILMYSKPEKTQSSLQMSSFRKLLLEENQYWIDYTSLSDIKNSFREHLQWDLYNLMKSQYKKTS